MLAATTGGSLQRFRPSTLLTPSVFYVPPGHYSSVVGGTYNDAGGTYAVVGGGSYNTANGHYSGVLSGLMNKVSANQLSSIGTPLST